MKTMEIELFSTAFFVSQSGYSKFYDNPEKALVGHGLVRIYQTIRRLQILLRTILATLLKTKCNDRLVENKIYREVGKECSTIAQMIVKDDRGKAITWPSISC